MKHRVLKIEYCGFQKLTLTSVHNLVQYFTQMYVYVYIIRSPTPQTAKYSNIQIQHNDVM